MKAVRVQCPAKLFLLGEYGVLFGGPALLMAVDRYVVVTLSVADDAVYRICSEGPDIATLEGRWHDTGIAWRHAEPAHKLVISSCDALIEAGAIDQSTPPFTARVDSTQLFEEGKKLGLGSSAAVCNAFIVAVCKYGMRCAQTHSAHALPFVLTDEFIYRVHKDFQQGHGSGADIAAGIHGGVFQFQRASDQLLPDIQPVSLPTGLHIGYIPVGKPASTVNALTRMYAFQSSKPDQFNDALAPLLALAGDGMRAVQSNNAREFAAVCHRYCHNLSDFGRTIDVDIVSDVHQRLHDLAGAHQIAYKPSGAGSGDFGLAFSTDINHLNDFLRAAREADFTPADLSAGDKCQLV